MTEQFRARTLGDLFVPIEKVYASLIAHLFSGNVDLEVANQLFLEFNLQQTASSYKRFLDMLRRDFVKPFDVGQYYRKSSLNIPSQYFDPFIQEFGFGKLSNPVNFNLSLLLKEKIVPIEKHPLKIKKKVKRKLAISEALQALDAKMFLPEVRTISRKEVFISAEMGFSSGAFLVARMTTNDILYAIGSIHVKNSYGDETYLLPIPITVIVTSDGATTYTAPYAGRFFKVPTSEVENALVRYFAGTKFVHDTFEFLKKREYKNYRIIYSYSPPAHTTVSGKKFLFSEGKLIVAAGFAPMISRFSKRTYYETLRKTPIKSVMQVLEERLGDFLYYISRDISTEFDPDIIYLHLVKELQR